jgi:hypothetical protein
MNSAGSSGVVFRKVHSPGDPVGFPKPENKSKYDICELYSRPRMCAHAPAHKLKGGWSIDKDFQDPITGRTYDLRNRKDQNEVRKMIRRDKPLVLTVSPPCTLFSIANQGPVSPVDLAGAKELMRVRS